MSRKHPKLGQTLILHDNGYIGIATIPKKLVRHVTEPVASCLDNPVVSIRLALRRLCREETTTIQGVKVQRTNVNKTPSYFVNGEAERHDFEAAVSRIAEIAAAGRRA
jgi:hypothetical protein